MTGTDAPPSPSWARERRRDDGDGGASVPVMRSSGAEALPRVRLCEQRVQRLDVLHATVLEPRFECRGAFLRVDGDALLPRRASALCESNSAQWRLRVVVPVVDVSEHSAVRVPAERRTGIDLENAELPTAVPTNFAGPARSKSLESSAVNDDMAHSDVPRQESRLRPRGFTRREVTDRGIAFEVSVLDHERSVVANAHPRATERHRCHDEKSRLGEAYAHSIPPNHRARTSLSRGSQSASTRRGQRRLRPRHGRASGAEMTGTEARLSPSCVRQAPKLSHEFAFASSVFSAWMFFTPRSWSHASNAAAPSFA
jgi:hypothetical protein